MLRTAAGYVIVKVLIGEPHFIGACIEDMRNSTLERETYLTDIKIWKLELKGLAEEFCKLAETAEQTL